MAITNGQVANANEVMNAMGNIWNDTAQNIFNADYIGFDADLNNEGEPNLKNVFFNTGLTDSYASWGITQYNFTSGTFADTWTGAGTGSLGTTWGQTSGYIYAFLNYALGGNGGDTTVTSSAGTTPILLGDSESYILTYSLSCSSLSGDHAYLDIFDGTTVVSLANVNYDSTSSSGRYRLNIDKTGETCYFGTNFDTIIKTGTDLSSLNNGASWYLRIRAVKGNTGTGGNATAHLSGLTKLSSSTSNESIITVGTADETVTNLIPILNTNSAGTISADFEISVDNGTNYESVTNANIFRPTHTGTQIKLKAIFTSDASLNLTHLNEYAIKYNLY